MHPLLTRQLKKCFGTTVDFPAPVQRFIEVVGDAYVQSDTDRDLLEHSMELSSRELLERNQQLAQAEQKYRSIFEHATEGIFQISPSGQVLSANPALAKILGYDSPEQLKEQVQDVARNLYIEPGRWNELVGFLTSMGTISQFESRAVRKDGTLIWVSETTRAVYLGAGSQAKLSHYEGTVRDVTKRVQAELERSELQRRLLTLSREAGKAEVASSVLHNVGNVLNSVNVSASVISEQLQRSSIDKLSRIIELIRKHETHLGDFLTSDEKGRQIPRYMEAVVACIQEETASAVTELQSLNTNVEHIKRVISAQQDLAKSSALIESVNISNLFDDALNVSIFPQDRDHIKMEHDYDRDLEGMTDHHLVLQILINLLSNAKHALRASQCEQKVLTMRARAIKRGEKRWLHVEIVDNGVGIQKENLTRIFNHGFSTKKSGHGFGLHGSSNAAHQLGGSLVGESEGRDRGAKFVLELPFEPVSHGVRV